MLDEGNEWKDSHSFNHNNNKKDLDEYEDQDVYMDQNTKLNRTRGRKHDESELSEATREPLPSFEIGF